MIHIQNYTRQDIRLIQTYTERKKLLFSLTNQTKKNLLSKKFSMEKKFEQFQDNRILAELEQPRTTGPSSYIMTSSGGLASSLVSQPPLSLSNISTNLASSYGATAVSLGAQSSGTTSYSATTTHNLSPLPIRANQISTMPPLCQVLRICYSNLI